MSGQGRSWRSARSIGVDDVAALRAGANFYGSSIGSQDLGWLVAWLVDLLRENGPVPLVQAGELDANASCVAVLVMGSVDSVLDLMPTGDEVLLAARALEHRLGDKVDAVFALDAATINALIPVAAAAQLGVPLVDCDAMGRILPLIYQTSLHLAGIPVGPIAAAGATGETFVLDSQGARADWLMRSVLDRLGGWALTAMSACSAADLRVGCLPGTMSRLMKVGRVMLESSSVRELVDRLGVETGSWVLGRGPVIEVEHGTRSSDLPHPSHPASVIIAETSSPWRLIRLEIQNEILVAMVDGAVTAAVPDGICLVDARSGEIVGTDQVQVGDVVEVLVVPAAAVWHSRGGLALAGPAAFGFPIEHPRLSR
jgi:uncharacterized protein